ncbi:hypothetical protein, partial [Streptomyces sp. NPDC056982]|uniref:hypothetical protein n=1 Tax=Streptomyces sp. NPDC056982 TaxID=3345986 RepID=UPI003641F33B
PPSDMTTTVGRERTAAREAKKTSPPKVRAVSGAGPGSRREAKPPQDRWARLKERAQDVQPMAIEEACARDIGCAGTLVTTVVDRCHQVARLRDRRDRPTMAPGG